MFRIYYGQCSLCPIGIIRPIVVRAGFCKQHNEEKKNIGKPPKAAKQKTIVRKEPNYGQCKKCEPNTNRLLVVKNLCKYHNEEKKNAGKPPKILKLKVVKNKEFKNGQCKLCPENTISILEVNHYCKFHNDQKKKEEKSKRVIKLINKSEKKKSTTKLKEELDAVFSLYIRHKDSIDGRNKCFTCSKILPIKELQCGHYESRKYLALRYSEKNCECQCEWCNIVLKGNYTIYAQRMIEKYGKKHLDMLAIKKHNRIKWTAFEYELLIKEYTEKLNKIKETL